MVTIADATAAQTTLTGTAKGKTNVAATVTVEVNGKATEVTADAVELEVMGANELVFDGDITGAEEVVVNETADIEVAVDTGDIESVVWAVEGDAAVIETSAVEVAQAKVIGKKAGEVTVKATVTAKSGDKTGTREFTKTIKVVPVLVVDAAITAGKNEIAQNEAIVLGIDNKVGDVQSVAWSVAPAESASIEEGEENTAVLTGKDAGEVTVTATVTVKSGTQTKTTDLTKKIVINKNYRLSLRDMMLISGLTITDAAEYTEGPAIENEDGSITFHTSALYSGGGVIFALNPTSKGAVVDLAKYSAVKILGDEDSDVSMTTDLVTKVPENKDWWSVTRKPNTAEYFVFNAMDVSGGGGGKNGEKVISLSGHADVIGVQVKYNGHNKPAADATENEQKAVRVKVDVKGLELIAK